MRTRLIAAAVLSLAGIAHGASGFTLNFNNAPGSTLANTGFTNVYTEDNTGYDVGGGNLTIRTLPGDTYGDFGTDPDTAKNMFYNVVDVGASTTATARIHVTGLNQNFHGGGVWMGTDQDHYARLGVFHNSFLGGGPLGVELLRENEDRWAGATPPGPGDDILGNGTGIGGASPQVTAIDIILRIVRNGNTVVGQYSLDNGVSFASAGSFGGFALPGDPQGNGSNTEEAPVSYKVGLYAFGGPDNSPQASFAFDSLVVTPEPTSLTALAAGALLMRRRRV